MICEVGKEPYVKEIPNDLETINKIIGGYMEVASLTDDLIVVCNEEGMRLDLPLNDNLGLNILGNFFVARIEGTDLASITDEDIELLNRMHLSYQMELMSRIHDFI